MKFAQHIATLPKLGVGISGEYGSAAKGIDVLAFQADYPELVHFFEYGGDLDRGLDDQVRRWAAQGLPCTYHFLDVNIEERIDLDDRWLMRTAALAREIGAAWLCGDAGRWHFSSRERGHQMLMPPILCLESVLESVDNIVRIQTETGLLCLPENPPGVIYLGDMHILDYFGELATRSDCGLLLDCAHLAIFQQTRGLDPLTAFDNFPLDRIVEIHVAGGVMVESQGYQYIDDNHSPEPLPATWEIVEYVVARAPNLKAIVYECEYNSIAACLDNFNRLNTLLPVS